MGRRRRWIPWGAGAGGLGAATAATAAGACCVPVAAPLLIAVLGVSGAVWAAGLAAWAPLLLALSGLLLAVGFASLRRSRAGGNGGPGCAVESRRRPLVALLLRLGAAVWLLALIVNVLARWPGLGGLKP